MKCAVFPCLGLGDGLIALVLSHNLSRAGHQVDTFHPFMGQMQSLFPDLPILDRPEGVEFLREYDRLFIVYEKLDWMQNIIRHTRELFPEKTTILNPIATPNRDYPFWEEGRFDGNYPFADNLVTYCKESLGIEDPVKENGIELPSHIVKRKYMDRVVIHPTSSRVGKNWMQGQFLDFAKKLEKGGLEPVFILTDKEKLTWPGVEAPRFKDLNAVTEFVAESGWMVGNDSGIGHLASCLGVPTLTICRSEMAANFWRPSWSEGRVIIPPKWIPNLKGLRWRDKKWQHFVPVHRVYREFSKFRESCVLSN